MKITVMSVLMVVMGLVIVSAEDCNKGNPPTNLPSEGMVKASPTPTPVPGTAR